MSAYQCRVVSGTRSATNYLSPMLDAWAEQQGIELEPGTFNLCADRFVMIAPGQRCESLTGFGQHVPRFQQEKVGFHPRLYPVSLSGSVDAWLYRWSEPAHLRKFVGSQPGVCEDATRFCEIVADVNLRETLGVEDGDTVTMDLTRG